MTELHMTEAEFRKYVDQAFLNGSEAAFEAMAGVIGELRKKVADATPGNPEESR